MSAKLARLNFPKRFSRWFQSGACVSSIPCGHRVEDFPRSDHSSPVSCEFHKNTKLLRIKLVPDNLIRVLGDSSDLNTAVKVFKWATQQNRFRHTAGTYYVILLKLGLAGNVDEMEELCKSFVKERCPGIEQALVGLINAFLGHERLNEATRVLVNMNLGGFRPSINTFNALLCALVEKKRIFQDVLFVYKEMVKGGVLPNVDTLNCLLKALFEADHVETALNQFKRMNNKGCAPNSRTFEILIKGLISKNRIDEAVSILGVMLDAGCQPELSFYACTIPLFCRENKPDEGIKLLRMMKASKFSPDSHIYGALVQCLCKNLFLDDAVTLLEEMTESGLTANSSVFVDLIEAFCNSGKIDDAVKFLEDKSVPQTSPYNALLKGCCNAGKFLLAEGVLGTMLERNIDDIDSWNILLEWLCQNSEIRKASEFLGRMIMHSVVPNCDTYSAFIVGNCKLSNYGEALKLFHEVCANCWVVNSVSYSELVEGLCSAVKIPEAGGVFCYMSSNRYPLQSSSFDILIKGMCETGKTDEAIRMLELAYYSDTSCSTMTYNTIMLGVSQSEKIVDLLLPFSHMLVKGCTPDLETYCILIQSLSKHQVKNSVILFNVMINEGLMPDSETLFNFLLCIANHSQLHKISTAINKLISKGNVLNSEMYNLLVNGLWKEGKRDEASQLLDLMLEKGWVPDATTHGLLIGSLGREKTERETLSDKRPDMQDNVSCILAEGLGKI